MDDREELVKFFSNLGHSPKLVGGFSPPLWKTMEWKSVGIMKFPTEWKNEIHVPNHQLAGVAFGSSMIMLLKVFESQSQELWINFEEFAGP